MPSEVVNFDYLLRAPVINELGAENEDAGGNGLFCVNSLSFCSANYCGELVCI
jgi:hypothetical protein